MPEINFASSLMKVESRIYTEQSENPFSVRCLIILFMISKCA
jgi:hypothetical protein